MPLERVRLVFRDPPFELVLAPLFQYWGHFTRLLVFNVTSIIIEHNAVARPDHFGHAEQRIIDFDNPEEVQALIKQRLSAKLEEIKARPKKRRSVPKPAPEEQQLKFQRAALLVSLRNIQDGLADFQAHPDAYERDAEEIQAEVDRLQSILNQIKST